MSTNDVPGANPDNNDELGMGCWAEHHDGSLIFVESTEGDRVVYSIFDMSRTPPIEYRDAMPTAVFEKAFSYGGDHDDIDNPGNWTWHDKTPFDWNRVIKAGVPDGVKAAFADHTLSAAQRVADSLKLRGDKITRDLGHRTESVLRRSGGIWDKLSRAIAELGRYS
jgi:hypothetical protein